jgi:choline dehydrogenase-like flavoprotein
MTLPLAQSRVLRYLAHAGPATELGVTAGLRMGRTDVHNHLRALAAKGLAVADASTCPASYTATDDGKAILAAGDGA